MTDTPIDREAVERLADKWQVLGYTDRRDPSDFCCYLTHAEAKKAGDTIRVLLAARDADAARIEALEAEVAAARDFINRPGKAGRKFATYDVEAATDMVERLTAALRDTGNEEGE